MQGVAARTLIESRRPLTPFQNFGEERFRKTLAISRSPAPSSSNTTEAGSGATGVPTNAPAELKITVPLLLIAAKPLIASGVCWENGFVP